MSTEVSAAAFPVDPREIPGDIARGGVHLARWLIGAATPGILTAGLAALDKRAARQLWTRTEPNVKEYPLHDDAPQDVGIIGIGGFNNYPGYNTEALMPTLAPLGRVAILEDSHGPLNIADNTEKIADWCATRGVSKLVLAGFSQGFMLSVLAAPDLQAKGLNLAIIGDSGPYDFEDVKSDTTRQMLKILAFLGEHELYGGPLIRRGLETLGYGLDHKHEKGWLKTGLAKAREKARLSGTPSNAQCLSRTVHLKKGDIGPALDLIPNVPILYIGTSDPKKDTVINQETAPLKIRARHKGPFHWITHPDLGHANAAEHPGSANEMMGRAMRLLGHAAHASRFAS